MQPLGVGTTAKMLGDIERVFGNSVTDIAKMLKVSRPMIYLYREGKEPALENRRRLQALSSLASEFIWHISEPLTNLLRIKQPEGRTLLEFLSERDLDVPAVRRVLERNVTVGDKELRTRLAGVMMRTETIDERLDIIRERHKARRSVIVGDPENPGKLIKILPSGRRIHGRLVKRRFIPDDK